MNASRIALLAATVFESREQPWQVVGVTVDHGLQEGSAERAEALVGVMAGIGVDETVSARVTVEGAGEKAVASIDFGSQGVKRLLMRYAPVEKL